MVASGARELLRLRETARLVGADVLCSLVYGVETVLLVTVASRLSWSSAGYGLLLAGIGVGGVVGTVLTPFLVRRLGRERLQALALALVALSLPLLIVVPSTAVVLALAAFNGAGSLAVEVRTETALAEQLPDEIFARAYGFAFPVSIAGIAGIAGIAVGSLLAGPLASALGLLGAMLVLALVLLAYAVPVRSSRLSRRGSVWPI